MLRPVLGCPVQERHRYTLGSSVEGHQDCHGASCLQKRGQRGQHNAIVTATLGGCGEDGARLFSEVCRDCMRGNKHKLKRGKFSLGVKKEKCLPRGLPRWDPREAGTSEVFTSSLGELLSNLT